MIGKKIVRGWYPILAVLGVLLAGLTAALGQQNPNERVVKPEPNVQDKDDISSPDSKIWVLEFTFKDPRIITANIPGRGRRVCWYMWYQVINRTKEPHFFYPDFELVTLDKNTVHHDQSAVLPTVLEAIRQQEDPTNYLNLKNSVTIYKEPVLPSRPDAAPRPVTGVAIWDDVNPDTTRFDIFVTGLSNGWSETDPIGDDKTPVVRRKTLQLSFRRPGDRYHPHSGEIQFMGRKWVYRAADSKLPDAPDKPKEDKKDEKVGLAPNTVK